MLDLLNLAAGGGMGILGGIAGLFGGNKQVRREEHYNPAAYKMLRDANAQNEQINPQATARRSRQDVQDVMTGAMGNAANMAAGQVAQGGDFGAPMAAAIAGSQATQAAAAPFAGQLADINQQADQTSLNQVNNANSIANSTASLSNHVTYENQQGNNPLLNFMKGLQGGTNAGINLLTLVNSQNREASSPQQRIQIGPRDFRGNF